MDLRSEPTHRTVEPATVRWDGNRPVSVAYNDVYHDAKGLHEVDRVFLEPAKLEPKFAATISTFTIAELGFGSALNFAISGERFLSHSTGCLHYISFEQSPMDLKDLVKAARHSKLGIHRELIQSYPPHISGWHRRRFANGRVQLSLYLGNVIDGLKDLLDRQPNGVDAWFFDGFAPKFNPDMWSTELCESAAKLSNPGATVSTFSSAGVVKRALRHANFKVFRIDQRPYKHHSLLGVAPGNWLPHPASVELTSQTISVLGAGFAGCSVARALADRGAKVSIHDRNIAAGASAIPAAIVHARLLTDGSATASMRAHSYAFACEFYRGRKGYLNTGALQLPGVNTPPARIEKMKSTLPNSWVEPVSSVQASTLAGSVIQLGGLFFPQAAVVDGSSVCRALLDHPGIHFDQGPPRGEITVYACGSAITQFFPEIEVTALGGQADRFIHESLHLPILGDGYFAPAMGGCWVGSTYEYQPWPTSTATAANLTRFRSLFPHVPGTSVETFRAMRAVTSDRVPIIGRVDSNTYISGGHGSNGSTSAALAGEWIASLIAGECPPVTQAIERLCRVERFKERQQRRPNPFDRVRPRTR